MTSDADCLFCKMASGEFKVDKLHDDVVTAINTPEVQRIFSEQGFVAVSGSPEQFAKRIADEASKWSKLSKSR